MGEIYYREVGPPGSEFATTSTVEVLVANLDAPLPTARGYLITITGEIQASGGDAQVRATLEVLPIQDATVRDPVLVAELVDHDWSPTGSENNATNFIPFSAIAYRTFVPTVTINEGGVSHEVRVASARVNVYAKSSSAIRTVKIRQLRILLWNITDGFVAAAAFQAQGLSPQPSREATTLHSHSAGPGSPIYAAVPLGGKEMLLPAATLEDHHFLILWNAEIAIDGPTDDILWCAYAADALLTEAKYRRSNTFDTFHAVGGMRVVTLPVDTNADGIPSAGLLSFEIGVEDTDVTVSVRGVTMIAVLLDGNPDCDPITPEDSRYVEQENAVTTTATSAASGISTSVSFTAVVGVQTRYILLTTAHVRADTAASAALFDVRAEDTGGASTFIFSHSPDDAATRFHPWLQVQVIRSTTTSPTHRIRIWSEGGTHTITGRHIRIAALEVTQDVGAGVDVAVLAAELQLLRVINVTPESLTLDATGTIVRILSFNATLTLSDVVQRAAEATDALTLQAALVAVILPPPPVSAAYYGPIQLHELVLPGGTRRYSQRDLYMTDPAHGWNGTLFEGLVMELSDIPLAYNDTQLAFQALTQISVTLGNLAGSLGYLLDEDPRGFLYRVWAHDPVLGELELRFSGIVTSHQVGYQVHLEASVQNPALFAREIGRVITTKEFPKAETTAIGKIVTLLLGSVRNLACPLISTDIANKLWDYLVAERVPVTTSWPYGTGTRTITNVYRNGILIAPSEYQVLDGAIGSPTLTLLRFVQDQAGATITCDVRQENAVLRNPVRIAQYLLASVGGEGIDGAAFDAAANKCVAAYAIAIPFDFWLDSIRTFFDILSDVSFRQHFARNEAGQWTVAFDEAPASTSWSIGVGPGTANNILEDGLGPIAHTDFAEAVTSLTIRYNRAQKLSVSDQPYASDKELPAFAFATGNTSSFDAPYVREHATADAVLEYRIQRLLTNDRKLTITLGADGRHVLLGQIGFVTVPFASHNLVNALFEPLEILRGQTRYQITLARWSPGIYLFQRHPETDDPIIVDPTEPDLSFTPPPKLASFIFDGWTAPRLTREGVLFTRASVRAVLPNQRANGTHIVFRLLDSGAPDTIREVARREIGTTPWDGTTAITQEITDLVTSPTQTSELQPGRSYDLLAYITNVNHEAGLTPDAQNGEVSMLTNLTPPGDTVRPPTTGLTLVAVVSSVATANVVVEPSAGWMKPPDLDVYELWRARTYTSVREPPAFGSAILLQVGQSMAFSDGQIQTGTNRYWYWVRLRDFAGNTSDPIGPSAPLDFRNVRDTDTGPPVNTLFRVYQDSLTLTAPSAYGSNSGGQATRMQLGQIPLLALSGGLIELRVRLTVRVTPTAVTDALGVRVVRLTDLLAVTFPFPEQTILKGLPVGSEVQTVVTIPLTDTPVTSDDVRYYVQFQETGGATWYLENVYFSIRETKQ